MEDILRTFVPWPDKEISSLTWETGTQALIWYPNWQLSNTDLFPNTQDTGFTSNEESTKEQPR